MLVIEVIVPKSSKIEVSKAQMRQVRWGDQDIAHMSEQANMKDFRVR